MRRLRVEFSLENATQRVSLDKMQQEYAIGILGDMLVG